MTGAARVHFAFAEHVALAELREGRATVIDLGVPSGAKYTMGGWLTNVGEDAVVYGRTVAVVPGQSAKFVVPAEFSGAGTLALEIGSFRRDRVRVYWDGQEVGGGDIGVTSSDFSLVQVAIPAARLSRGEHMVQLRVSGTGSGERIRRAGMLVNWIRLVPEGEPIVPTAPPSPAALAPEGAEAASLEIPNGLSLGYAMQLPAGARLRGSVKGPGTLEVIAEQDGEAAASLGRIAGAASGAPLDVDLGPLSSKVVRIVLKASGDVRVVGPEVITRDGASATLSRRPKNVVVYLIDTLRADALKPINPESRVETPGLATFLENAVTFARAHTQENWTKPSVTTLLSSLFPWQHNAITTEAVVPDEVTLLPEMLRAHGFYTGAFIANGYVSDRFGFRQGWSTYRNYIREGRRSPAQYVAADVIEWLDQRPTDQPFFLYVHTIDPHVPYRPPPQFLSMYDPSPYAGVVDFRGDSELLEKIKIGQIRLEARDKTHLRALYDGEISYHDVHFASILNALARRGIADDTMVVVTADHGEEFWDHGSVGHGHSVYEELLHIPMFVKLPGAPRIARIDAPVGLVDVVPTVLDAMGQDIPADCAGRSFLPLLLRGDERAPRVAVSGFMEGWRVANVGSMKLIHRTVERVMLYDLESDPGETRDIASDHPIALRYLRGMLGVALGGASGNEMPSSGRATARRPVVIPQQNTAIDPETEAQLRALGYVGSSRR